MTLRVVALGDSTSCGEGVGLAVPPALTWPARLARALPGGELVPLAVAGARVRDVLARQLDAALDAEPHLATLLIGLNDVGRGRMSGQLHDDLLALVRGLRRSGATVLLGRLHDPTRTLPVPAPVRARVQSRVAAVNRAVDAAAAEAQDGRGGDVLVLDLALVPGLEQRRAWAVDRLHPHEDAHALVAAEAGRVLAAAGLPVGPVDAGTLPGRAPGLHEELWWTARHGIPWAVSHLRDLAPVLAVR